MVREHAGKTMRRLPARYTLGTDGSAVVLQEDSVVPD